MFDMFDWKFAADRPNRFSVVSEGDDGTIHEARSEVPAIPQVNITTVRHDHDVSSYPDALVGQVCDRETRQAVALKNYRLSTEPVGISLLSMFGGTDSVRRTDLLVGCREVNSVETHGSLSDQPYSYSIPEAVVDCISAACRHCLSNESRCESLENCQLCALICVIGQMIWRERLRISWGCLCVQGGGCR